MIAFGPVPSRRLGRSLGINNIPPKVCTYACVYCQLGRTIRMQVARQAFYKPEDIRAEVEEKIGKTRRRGEPIDYLTFVPDGEPALDANLGREIELFRPLGIKIAVITNASLIWGEDVREALGKADWASLKVDAVSEEVWRKINRPHRSLQLDLILEGMREFAKAYRGELATETMLVQGLNDSDGCVEEVADFLAELKPAEVYLADLAVKMMLDRLAEEDRRRIYGKLVPEPGRVVAEVLCGRIAVDEIRVTCPVLVIIGGKDKIIAAKMGRKVARKYKADFKEYPGRGHWMMEEDWEKAAHDLGKWLEKRAGSDHRGS